MAKRVDLLQGNIMTTLVQLALPIMGTALIQMAYNLVDMVCHYRILRDGAVTDRVHLRQ